jgi:phosphopantetheine adenylyltransferase
VESHNLSVGFPANNSVNFSIKKMVEFSCLKVIRKDSGIKNLIPHLITKIKMKQFKIIIAASIIAVLTGIISCNEPTEKKTDQVKEDQQKMIVTDTKKQQSNIDDEIAYNSFRMEMNEILLENEVRMMQLKTKILSQRADVRRQYEKDIDDLRAENEKLKSDLNAFTYSTNENWQEFKSNIVKDIDRIGKTLSTQTEKAKN